MISPQGAMSNPGTRRNGSSIKIRLTGNNGAGGALARPGALLRAEGPGGGRGPRAAVCRGRRWPRGEAGPCRRGPAVTPLLLSVSPIPAPSPGCCSVSKLFLFFFPFFVSLFSPLAALGAHPPPAVQPPFPQVPPSLRADSERPLCSSRLPLMDSTRFVEESPVGLCVRLVASGAFALGWLFSCVSLLCFPFCSPPLLLPLPNPTSAALALSQRRRGTAALRVSSSGLCAHR